MNSSMFGKKNHYFQGNTHTHSHARAHSRTHPRILTRTERAVASLFVFSYQYLYRHHVLCVNSPINSSDLHIVGIKYLCTLVTSLLS